MTIYSNLFSFNYCELHLSKTEKVNRLMLQFRCCLSSIILFKKLSLTASFYIAISISEATSSTDLGIAAMGSSSSVRSRQFLENSVNWGPIIKKYRNLKIETPEDEHKST